MNPPWTILKAMQWTSEYFAQKGVSSPRLDAEVLLAHALHSDRTRLYMEFDRPLNKEELARYRRLLLRRAAREPLAYITGEKEFWSLKFKVSPAVLIPRPETEILLEKALSLWKNRNRAETPLILDMGTGSGVLAVCLAREIEGSRIIASDISPQALEIARENARAAGVADRIEWRPGDLFETRPPLREKMDMIISNPPYIEESELEKLQPEVRSFEPRQALAAGRDGLRIIRDLLAKSPHILKPEGFLCLEIGAGQGKTVTEIVSANPQFSDIELTRDYAGMDRVISARRQA